MRSHAFKTDQTVDFSDSISHIQNSHFLLSCMYSTWYHKRDDTSTILYLEHSQSIISFSVSSLTIFATHTPAPIWCKDLSFILFCKAVPWHRATDLIMVSSALETQNSIVPCGFLYSDYLLSSSCSGGQPNNAIFLITSSALVTCSWFLYSM